MNKKSLQIIVLIGALLMIVFSLLNIDYDDLSNMTVNRSYYTGIFSMVLVVLAMYLSIKDAKNNES